MRGEGILFSTGMLIVGLSFLYSAQFNPILQGLFLLGGAIVGGAVFLLIYSMIDGG